MNHVLELKGYDDFDFSEINNNKNDNELKFEDEAFRECVKKVYMRMNRLFYLELRGTCVYGAYYSKTNRDKYEFVISYNHKGKVDGKYAIKRKYQEYVGDEDYIDEVAYKISVNIDKAIRKKTEPWHIW